MEKRSAIQNGTRSGKGTAKPRSQAARASSTGKSTAKASASKSSASKAPYSKSSRARSSASKRRKRVKKPARFLRFLGVILILMLGAVGAALLTGQKSPESLTEFEEAGETFYEGIYVSGVSVGGMTLQEAESAVTENMRGRLSAVSVTLTYEGGSKELSAAELGADYDFESAFAQAAAYARSGSRAENTELREQLPTKPVDFPVSITYSRSKILSTLNGLAPELALSPTEPYAVPSLDENNRQHFKFHEGSNGRTLDAEATEITVESALSGAEGEHTVAAVFTEIPPETSLSFLQENTHRISTYTTSFRTSSSDEVVQNRVYNIKKAAGLINCTVVNAGETWSFNDFIGPRTLETGWKEANGISRRKQYTLQAGGGICQVSTTLYNALLRGNIKITERRAHTIPSDYVPKGLDATVDSNGPDFCFQNDTGAPIYIFAYVKQNESSSRRLDLTVSIYGKALPSGTRYEARSEIVKTIVREETVYTDDETIPKGYQIESIPRRDGVVAEVYLDRYENDALVESTLLYTDTYDGNVAEVRRGTGDPAVVPVPEGAVAVGGSSEAGELAS